MELRPNFKKALLFYSLIILGIAVGIALFIFFFFQTVDIGLIVEGFEAIGMTIETPSVSQPLITLAVFAVLITLIVAYGISQSVYDFTADRLSVIKNFFIMNLSQKDIPYQNIVKVTPEKTFPNTGKLTLELSGLKTQQLILKFIDSPEQSAIQIQTLINTYRANYYAQYSEQQRMENYFDRR